MACPRGQCLTFTTHQTQQHAAAPLCMHHLRRAAHPAAGLPQFYPSLSGAAAGRLFVYLSTDTS